MNRLDGFNVLVFAVVRVVQNRVYGLAETGLPRLIRAFYAGNPQGAELYLACIDAPVIGDLKTKGFHAASLERRRRSMNASRATVPSSAPWSILSRSLFTVASAKPEKPRLVKSVSLGITRKLSSLITEPPKTPLGARR